ASKPELARVPLEPGVAVGYEDVDVIHAGRPDTSVQVVTLEERSDFLHLTVVLDGEAERIPYAQCTALAALLLRPQPLHEKAKAPETTLETIERIRPRHLEADVTHAG